MYRAAATWRRLSTCNYIPQSRGTGNSLSRRKFGRRVSPIVLLILTIGFLLISFFVLVFVLDYFYQTRGFQNSSAIHGREFIRPLVSEDRFSVVINTYKRPEMLKKSIIHYAGNCGLKFGIEKVFIIWSEMNTEPPSLEEMYSDNSGGKFSKNLVSISFVRVPKDSLNSRFLPIQELENSALFMVDDDVLVNCRDLNQGFVAWKYHPRAMVGYYPRLVTSTRVAKPQAFTVYGYNAWPFVFFKSKFNLILTKASFLHRDYLRLYSDSSLHPKEILDYVDQHNNCEDIAMAMLVANQTKTNIDTYFTEELNSDLRFLSRENKLLFCSECPVYIQGSVKDTGIFNGISSKSGHMLKRDNCVNHLTKIYEDYGWHFPFKDLSLEQNSWVHHFPGFWWQQSPSNFFEWFALGKLF